MHEYSERRRCIVSVIVDDTSDEKEVVNVPIEKKLNLTIREAAEYSNIGMNKINDVLRNPMCSFVLYVGTKKLVKRKEFEQFLAGCKRYTIFHS